MSDPISVGSNWAQYDEQLAAIGTCEAHREMLKIGFISAYRIAIRHAVREFNLSVQETGGGVEQATARLNAIMNELDLLEAELRFG